MGFSPINCFRSIRYLYNIIRFCCVRCGATQFSNLDFLPFTNSSRSSAVNVDWGRGVDEEEKKNGLCGWARLTHPCNDSLSSAVAYPHNEQENLLHSTFRQSKRFGVSASWCWLVQYTFCFLLEIFSRGALFQTMAASRHLRARAHNGSVLFHTPFACDLRVINNVWCDFHSRIRGSENRIVVSKPRGSRWWRFRRACRDALCVFATGSALAVVFSSERRKRPRTAMHDERLPMSSRCAQRLQTSAARRHSSCRACM